MAPIVSFPCPPAILVLLKDPPWLSGGSVSPPPSAPPFPTAIAGRGTRFHPRQALICLWLVGLFLVGGVVLPAQAGSAGNDVGYPSPPSPPARLTTGPSHPQRRAGTTPLKKPAYRAVIRSLIGVPDGTLWVGTFGRGVWCLASGSTHQIGNPDGTIPSHRISRLALAGNRLIAATAGEGLLAWNLAASRWEPVLPAPAPRLRYLHGLWADASGTLVLGSVGSGAALLSGGQWRYLGATEGLTDDWVNDVVDDLEGWWLATSRGLFHLNRGLGRIDRRLFPRDDWEDPDINVLTRIDDRLVLGTTEDGVVILASDGRAVRVRGTGGAIHALTGPVPDPAGTGHRLWAAGDHGLWLILLPPPDIQEPPRSSEVPGPWSEAGVPKALALLPNGDLVIGTMQGSLLRLSGDPAQTVHPPTAAPPASAADLARTGITRRSGGYAPAADRPSAGEEGSPRRSGLVPTLFARFKDGNLTLVDPVGGERETIPDSGPCRAHPPGACPIVKGGEE